MTEPFIAHSELTNEIYIVVGKEKYRVTEQAIKAVMAIELVKHKPILDAIRTEMLEEMLSYSGTGEEVIQAYVDGLKKGVDILDKYKTVSEAEE
jgi:hypothetical protein